MNFERKIFPKLLKHLQQKQVTVLTGMRRTGKTTLLKQLKDESKIKQKLFFDLERMDNRLLFSQENYDGILYALEQQGIDFSQKVLICIDEIQLSPNLPSVIKYLYDHYDIKFILTGSSSYYIKNKFQESMAGRKKIFEIHPLDFGEFLSFNNVSFKGFSSFENLKFNESEFLRLNKLYDSFIEFGAFPEVVLAQNKEEKLDLLQDIYSSYMNMDILQVSDIQKPNELMHIIRLLSSRIGSKIDVSKIANTVKISRQTVENYLNILESTFLIHFLPVYSQNPDKEIVKAKKVYFSDNGIANINGDLSGGQKFENAVFNQLKHFGDLAYYQLKTGNEIDFILNKEIAFEVKELAYHNDLNSLKRLSKNIGIKENKVISRFQGEVFEELIWGGMLK